MKNNEKTSDKTDNITIIDDLTSNTYRTDMPDDIEDWVTFCKKVFKIHQDLPDEINREIGESDAELRERYKQHLSKKGKK